MPALGRGLAENKTSPSENEGKERTEKKTRKQITFLLLRDLQSLKG